MCCVFLCSADGEKSQNYDEECAEEDEPPGEEGGSRPTRVRYETQALALRKAESREEGQAVAASAAAAFWQGGGPSLFWGGVPACRLQRVRTSGALPASLSAGCAAAGRWCCPSTGLRRTRWVLCLGSSDRFRSAELERLTDVNVCFEGEKSYSFLQPRELWLMCIASFLRREHLCLGTQAASRPTKSQRLC